MQEAFAELLASPSRKPTRASAWCLVRAMARERRAEVFQREEYVDDEDDEALDPAGAWLLRALRG